MELNVPIFYPTYQLLNCLAYLPRNQERKHENNSPDRASSSSMTRPFLLLLLYRRWLWNGHPTFGSPSLLSFLLVFVFRKSALSLQLTEAYFESILSDQSIAQSWNHEKHFGFFDGIFCLFPVLATNTGTWMILPRTSVGKAGKRPFPFGIPSLHHRASRFVSPLYESIPKYIYNSNVKAKSVSHESKGSKPQQRSSCGYETSLVPPGGHTAA